MKPLKKDKPRADKRKIERATGHLVRPPRLEAAQKNVRLKPPKKKPGTGKIRKMRKIDIPRSPADELRFIDRKH